MTRNTILGGPPSGTESAPGTGTEPETRDPLDEFVEAGDANTAFHRGWLYSLVALGFERPGEDFEEALAQGAFTDELQESAAAVGEPVADAAEMVGEALAERDHDPDTLHSEWVSLFGVEEGLTVSPYQLTYLPGPLMTTVRKLADLRGFYEAFGLSIVEGYNDRADHICFLTEFASHLSVREAALRMEEDDEGVRVVVSAQRAFFEDHLGRWYWRFADEVSKRDDGFYAALADLLATLVEAEIDRLDLEPDWVPDDPEVIEWTEDVFGDSGRDCGGCGTDAEGLDDLAPEMGDVPRGPPGGPGMGGDGLSSGDLNGGDRLDGAGN